MTGGYVTDVPYVRNFARELAPAWLDHVALIAGFTPPQREAGFAWCDLGCGYGVTAAIMAATHPDAVFYGIDAMPEHIEGARRFAAEASISNAHFCATDFDAASQLDLPAFDYIVSHGVYSWVDERARESWRRFVDRHLKPGGLLYISYNAMPGRAADLPLQRLVRALGCSLPGDSRERVMAALAIADSMADLKVPALVASPIAATLREPARRGVPAYLAHELMNGNWEALCVTDVRTALAPIGLTSAGSATLMENYDSFVLGRAARDLLAAIADPDVRELARDFFIDQFFRRDVFIRGGRRLSDDDRRARLLDSPWFLASPAESVEYQVSTPGGRLSFDNATARHIVGALAAGPKRLSGIAESIAPGDLLANALALSAAGFVWPVENIEASVDRVNDAIRRALRHRRRPLNRAASIDPQGALPPPPDTRNIQLSKNKRPELVAGDGLNQTKSKGRVTTGAYTAARSLSCPRTVKCCILLAKNIFPGCDSVGQASPPPCRRFSILSKRTAARDTESIMSRSISSWSRFTF